MEELDYYEILEINKNASAEEIKKAYRKMALKYHPDRNQGDKEAEENFKKVNEAYQILGDESKRSMYDRYGKAGIDGSTFGGGFGFEDLDLGDIFDSFFGGNSKARRQKPIDPYPLDIEMMLTLEFKEAIFGVKKDLKFEIKKPCKSCDSTGSKDKKTHTCPHCGGRGKVSRANGFINYVSTCPHCGGSGSIVKEKCPDCQGNGYVSEQIETAFEVPKGVNTGMKIRLSSKGNLSKSGESGDLYVLINVKEDKNFVRSGDDLYIEVPVFFTDAILGSTIEIPTIDGTTELKLKVGTRDKEQFVIKNEGVENVRNGVKGHLVVQVKIETPKKLNDHQISLLKELKESFDKEDGIFDKIKNWFK